MSYQQIDSPPAAQAEVQVNENNAALGQGFLYSHDITADTGLVVGINGGDFDANTVADATVTCTDNATNYIVANRSTRAVSVSTGTTNWNATTTYGRVGRAVFASGVLTYHDERNSAGGIFDHAAAAGGGDVVGPASATNGHVAVFNGTSGKLIADSGLTLSGTNTGDQSTVSGNAGTATALQTARNIDGQAFNGTADITVIAPGTHAATSKTTPVDADELPLVDSAASNVLKKLTWANLKATLKTYLDTLYAPIHPTVCLAIACSDETTALTTGTNKAKFINPYSTAFNVTAVLASLSTAQASGSIFTVDINEAGTSILSTKLTIDNTETNSSTAATAAVISDASLAAYAEVEVDIDQVGDGTAKGLKVYV
ncbi:MAG TPA: hypothetical protein VJN68_08655, partial [Burkholderiaceae bacterium]|nr:hypothetical protein [Burkholderiaceae bacterium]